MKRRAFLLCCGLAAAGRARGALSPLAPAPGWAQLEAYQGTISRDDFDSLLGSVYAPGGAARGLIEVRGSEALIRTGSGERDGFRLRFAPDRARQKPTPRFWKTRSELRDRTADRPLRGMHVALDPGHIGGDYARMEERWYQIGGGRPVMEGEMTLTVARLLEKKLQGLGAKVTLVRGSNKPVTRAKPKQFRAAALAELRGMGIARPRAAYSPDEPPGSRQNSIQWHEEKLFYRTSEIRARADLVNGRIRPDLVVCLHFNAEEWGDPRRPDFVGKNHLHLLVNGTYGRGELSLDDVRLDMLLRLLQRTYPEEAAASDTVASAMARATRLPAFVYPGNNARRTTRNPYVYARNLLANRLYLCPVLYLEPYVMNHRTVYERIQAGNYEGVRQVAGAARPSIFEEYAQSVADGLASHYRPGR